MKKFECLKKIIASFSIAAFMMTALPLWAKGRDACGDQNKKYIELYNKLLESLNYEKDIGPGKIFETALYGEYQKVIRKLGQTYVNYLKVEDNQQQKTNLVTFFRAIDAYKKNNQFNLNINDFKSALDDLKTKNFSPEEIYLLEKLIIHANDFIVRVNRLEDPKATFKNGEKVKAQKQKVSPLNRLVLLFSDLNKSSSIDNTHGAQDPNIKKVIDDAVKDNLNNLQKFINDLSPACLKSIKKMSPNKNLQKENYDLFLQSLISCRPNQASLNNNKTITDLEKILHFINTNEIHEKWYRQKSVTVTPNKQTGLEDALLESKIASTFDNKIRCKVVDGKLYLSNIPLQKGSTTKFDFAMIQIKENGTVLNKKLKDLVTIKQDKTNQYGLMVTLKNPNEIRNLILNIVDSSSCQDISLTKPETKPDPVENKPSETASTPAAETSTQVATPPTAEAPPLTNPLPTNGGSSVGGIDPKSPLLQGPPQLQSPPSDCPTGGVCNTQGTGGR